MKDFVPCLVVLLHLTFISQGIAREWRTANGKHSTEAECVDLLVVLKQEDGRTTKIPLSTLSVEDRKYVLDTLNVDLGSMENETKSRESFMEGTNQSGVVSLSVADNEFTVLIEGEVPPGIGTKIREGVYELRSTNTTLAKEYSSLSEFIALDRTELQRKLRDNETRDWLTVLLIALRAQKEDELHNVEQLILLDANLSLLSTRGNDLIDALFITWPIKLSNSQYCYEMWLYRELARTLSASASTNEKVDKLYSDRLDQLTSAPAPSDRAFAALRLYGSDGIADKAVPALTKSFESDVSKVVRVAAGVALGGFTKNKELAAASLKKKLAKPIEEVDDVHSVVWALTEIDPKSPVVKKFIHQCFEDYRKEGGSYVDMKWLLEFLNIRREQGVFAINDLLDTAKVVIDQGGEPKLESYGELLLLLEPTDVRVLRFFQSVVNSGPDYHKVYADSVVKRILAMQKKKEH